MALGNGGNMNIKKLAILSLLILTVIPSINAFPSNPQKTTLKGLAVIALGTYTACAYSITRPNNTHKLIGLIATYTLGFGTAATYVIHRLNKEQAVENQEIKVADDTASKADRRIKTIMNHLVA